MRTSVKKKMFWITCLLIFLTAFFGLCVWNHLPNQIPTHFSGNWQPNGWSSKIFTVLGLPTFLLFIHLAVVFSTEDDSKNARNKKIMPYIYWLVPILSVIMMGAIYAYALGWRFSGELHHGPELLLAAFLIACGLTMKKIKPNQTIGFRLPWTLASPKNWELTHLFARKVFIFGGLLMAGAIFVSSTLFWLLLASLVILPTGYSFYLHTKGI